MYAASALCLLDVQLTSPTLHVQKQTPDLPPHFFFLSPSTLLNGTPSFHLLGSQSLGTTFCSHPTSMSLLSKYIQNYHFSPPLSATLSKPPLFLPRLLQCPPCWLSQSSLLKPKSDPSTSLVKACHWLSDTQSKFHSP